MKMHIIFLSVLLSFVCGCAQPLNNVLAFQDKNTLCKTISTDSEFKTTYDADAESEGDGSDFQKKDTVLSKVNEETGSREAEYDVEEYDVEEYDVEEYDMEEYENSSFEETQSVLDKALKFCDVSQVFWQKGEAEKALDSLDEAYSLIVEVDADGNSGLMRQKEELRFTISKRILEIYASRNVVAKGKHNAIPMVMNEHVQAEIDRFTKYSNNKKKNFFARAYRRSGKYRPYIVAELEKAGMPAELSWLPLIESGFTVYALSKARALGLWQFIRSTGSKFGLKHDRYVDERLNPEKATKAAVAYMKELHNIFGDWSTVLAAYNCGENRVLRVIRQQNVNYLDNFWDLYKRLPRETARFVPKFLATLHIVSNPEKYGLDSVSTYSPSEYETVMISKQVNLKDAAKMIGVSKKTLKELNSELRYNIVPAGGYSLKVPPNTGDLLISRLDEMPVAQLLTQKSTKKKKSKASFRVRHHKVKKGDTLSTLARRYRTTVKKIVRYNKIRKNRIVVGKTIKIPVRGSSGKSEAYASKKKRRKASKHVVKKGDSLWNIARRYGTTTKKISGFNGLRKNAKLRIGQVLKIPGRGKYNKNKKVRRGYDLRTYRVKRGDIPQTIAKRYNMPLKRFLRVNRLTQRSKIYPGQKLHVD